jgi:hypothetical protein
MARTTKETKNERKEFAYDGKEFKYTGVIWPGLKQEGKNADRTPMSLTLNGVISIKGCKLVQTDKNTFIAFPQYQKKDGSYDSFVWIPKEFDELEAVAGEAEKALS